ncbi:MAG TPA: hypothetical protein VMV27_10955 [Candidatus Binataceae bacterium]|nr:hypothetical protein [Candidatus Binataceae bacterium]
MRNKPNVSTLALEKRLEMIGQKIERLRTGQDPFDVAVYERKGEHFSVVFEPSAATKNPTE